MTTAGILRIEVRTNGGGWGEWDTIQIETREGLIDALPGGSWFATPTQITEAGTFDADGRFTILTPLACRVIYRVDTFDLDGEAEDWAEGTEATTTITPGSPATINLPANGGGLNLSRLMVIGVVWHPYD